MRAFTCPACHQVVYVDNSTGLSCGARLGFVARHREMVAPRRPRAAPTATAG